MKDRNYRASSQPAPGHIQILKVWKVGETGEVTDHIVGEIQCGQGDEMFETLKVIRVREKLANVAFYSQTVYPVVVKVQTLQLHQMIHSWQ